MATINANNGSENVNPVNNNVEGTTPDVLNEPIVVDPNAPESKPAAPIFNEDDSLFVKAVKTVKSKGKTVKDLHIRNTKTEKMEGVNGEWTRISFTLDKPIDGYVADENGDFIEGKRNVIFTSTFALAGLIKESEELSWLANYIVEHPKNLALLFNGASITIVQQLVGEGEIYSNPFTTKEVPDEVTFEHNTIINHIIDIKLGKTGMKIADMLILKMLEEE